MCGSVLVVLFDCVVGRRSMTWLLEEERGVTCFGHLPRSFSP